MVIKISISSAVLDYLRANAETPQRYTPAHNGLINDVLSNPRRIGLTQVMEKFRDVSLRQGDSTSGISDIVIVTGIDEPDEVHIVNCDISPDNNFTKVRYRLNQRLKSEYDFFVRALEVRPKIMAVIRKRGTSQLHSQQVNMES